MSSKPTNDPDPIMGASSKLAMADEVFVGYMREAYPRAEVFDSVTSNTAFVSTLYHCWLYGRKLLADEFVANALEAEAALEASKPQRCPVCEHFGGDGTIQDGQHSVPCGLCGT